VQESGAGRGMSYAAEVMGAGMEMLTVWVMSAGWGKTGVYCDYFLHSDNLHDACL